MDNNINEALNKFMNTVQEFLTNEYKDSYCKKIITFKEGKKYIKVIENGGSVYCFIDKVTGDIYKPAGWNAPAKHARGNILRDDFMNCVTKYGIVYLR